MDRDLTKKELSKKKVKKTIGIIIPVLIGIILIFIFRSIINPPLSRGNILTAHAENGAIEATITASGTVIPAHEQVLTSPISTNIEEVYHKAGENVEAGQELLGLNTEFITLAHEKLLDELELIKNNKDQLNLKLERTRIDLQAQFDIKNLQAKSIENEVEQKKHLHEIGAGAKADLDQAKLKLDIARRELEQLKKQMDNQQASLVTDLKELELQINIEMNNLKKLVRQIELAKAKSNRNGVITWINDDIGASVNPGDIIARIADLNSFKVEAEISDIHAGKFGIGTPTKIRINDNELKGNISGVRPTIENGVISFIIELEENTSELLRPNLRVDVYVITSVIDNIVRVKNGPFVNGSGLQEIFVINDEKATKRKVKIGATNFDYVEIQTGVSPGEEIIISNMEDYIHREEIKLKTNK